MRYKKLTTLTIDSAQRKSLLPWVVLLAGFLAMYLPTLYDLFNGVWRTDKQAHGPIVLAVSIWFFYFKTQDLKETAVPLKAAPILGLVVFVLGLLMYVLGRSQSVLFLEVGSLVFILLGILYTFWGTKLARHYWFAFFFLLFVIPLPSSLVDAATQPMKIAASYGAYHLLSWLGYPVTRFGVIINIGPYPLFVADACAGLNSLFTLEALGLLYMNIMRHESALRNALLAALIIPISFTANVTRVTVLALITYHLGKEAGEGFLHGFSGMVLFMTALSLIIVVDSLLRKFSLWWESKKNEKSGMSKTGASI
ncbi:MAG TPA: exosortase B [Methylophilaceae bacterium]